MTQPDEYTILTAQSDARNEAGEREAEIYRDRTNRLRFLRHGIIINGLRHGISGQDTVEMPALDMLIILEELLEFREKQEESL